MLAPLGFSPVFWTGWSGSRATEQPTGGAPVTTQVHCAVLFSNTQIKTGILWLLIIRFVPRHEDELSLEADDPVLMLVQSEDLWCQGYNMRTGTIGIFPAFYVVKVEKELNQGAADNDKRRHCVSRSHCSQHFFQCVSPKRWLDRAVPCSLPGFSPGPFPQRQRRAVCSYAEGTAAL